MSDELKKEWGFDKFEKMYPTISPEA